MLDTRDGPLLREIFTPSISARRRILGPPEQKKSSLEHDYGTLVLQRAVDDLVHVAGFFFICMEDACLLTCPDPMSLLDVCHVM